MGSNLARFLGGLAGGIIEQAEDLERLNDGEETTQSLALRDYFSQLCRVADATDAGGVTDWAKVAPELGVDLDPDEMPQCEPPPVYMVEPPLSLEREMCAFYDHGDAVAYADAVSRPDHGQPEGFGEADVEDMHINGAAEALAAVNVERARVLEDLGFDGAAEDVERGARPLAGVLDLLKETIGLGEDEDTAQAVAKVAHWMAIDAEHGRKDASHYRKGGFVPHAAYEVQRDWLIALGADDGITPSTAPPRKVAGVDAEVIDRVTLTFADGGSPATFRSTDVVWRRVG